MDSTRRARAATGLTFLLLAGLGLLILQRSRNPGADVPIRFTYTIATLAAQNAPPRLFEAPEAAWAAGGEDQADLSALYLLYIPRLELYAPVLPVENELQQIAGRDVWQLSLPPEYAVGWSAASAPVGRPGNTVLVGHNNEFGEVFRGLEELSAGDEIYLRAEDGDRLYRVAETALFEEEYAPLEQRIENARWLAPTPDERLTLITCWPYFTNTHRLVVVARPG